ncbi:MAG: hypothetical protein KGK30_10250, partial [Elusimicrobia bacterium]|nr:hypothetical protein [Elusimicrobiota bacterium]
MIERYSRPEMAKVWSDENRLRAMLRVEEAFLSALSREKGIPSGQLARLRRSMDRSLLQASRGKEAVSGHEVIGLLQAVSARLAGKAPQLER